MTDLHIANLELIERMRFLEAHECEMASAELDPAQREIHFLTAALYAAYSALLNRVEHKRIPYLC